MSTLYDTETQLPTTGDAFKLHVLRATYQTSRGTSLEFHH